MKKIISKFIILISVSVFFPLAIFARGYDINLPLNGNSIADNTLQYNVLMKIYPKTIKKYPACTDISVKDTQVVHYPYDVVKKKDKFVSGYWKEIWTINACSQIYQVPITFYINKKGTEFTLD